MPKADRTDSTPPPAPHVAPITQAGCVPDLTPAERAAADRKAILALDKVLYQMVDHAIVLDLAICGLRRMLRDSEPRDDDLAALESFAGDLSHEGRLAIKAFEGDES